MSTDLQDRPDQDSDPIQHGYEEKFGQLAHAEQSGNTEGSAASSSNEGADANTLRQAEEGGSLYNPKGDSTADKTTDKPSEGAANDSLFNKSGDESASTLGKARTKISSVKSVLGKKKLLVGGALGGGTVVFGLLILLIILAGSLKIPHLAQNITAYQFARLSRQYAQSAASVTAEKEAIDAIPETTNDSLWNSVKNKYTSGTGKVKETWSKLDNYRPSKVIENLKTQNNLKINESTTRYGRVVLRGVTLNDTTYLKVQQGYTRFVPGLSSVLDFKNNVQLSEQFGPELEASLKAKEVGPIIRSVTARNLRKELGIGLIAWKLGNYKDKSDMQSRIQNVKDLQAANSTSQAPADPVTDAEKKAVDDAKAAQEAVLKDDNQIAEVITKGGVAPSIKAAIGKALAKSGVETAIGVVDPIYSVALPICIVYDGSVESSGPTIDNAVHQQEATYYYVASAADQEKNGSTPGDNTTELATAAQGLSDNLGDISQSNAITRANAGTADTSTSLSAEASAGGNFTLLNVLLGSGTVAGTLNTVAGPLCRVLTNTKVAIGVGVVNVGLAIFSAGTAPAAEEAAGVAATTATKEVAKNLFERLVTKAGSSTSRAKEIVLDTVKSTTKVVGATVVAKLIVASRAGQLNSGLSQGTDLANIADSGGNITAGEICRAGIYCRPLAPAEIAESDQSDKTYLAYQNKSKSAYDRYLSVSNVGSLVSKVAMTMNVGSRGSIIQSIVRVGIALFRPAILFNLFSHNLTGIAEADAVNTTYQNVQFGWSKAEDDLINSSTSYTMLENQRILDASGKEDDINSHYGACFTSSLGTLLSAGDILRDSSGNVLQSGYRCSPDSLGPNNIDSNSPCGSQGCGDLVFRWRLAHRYDTVVNQLTGIQDAHPTSS